MEYTKRKSPRIPGYSYATPNYYFITICTYEKACIFGKPHELDEYGTWAKEYLGQHRTMEAAAFAGSFLPIVQCEKWEIHPVFRHFPHFRLKQNLSPKALAPLCGIALTKPIRN